MSAVSLYTFVDLYSRALTTADHLLTKGQAHAAALGVTEQEMLNDWRLADDMHPLAFQLKVVINFTRAWPARVAGLPVPDPVADDLDAAGFHAAIAEAKACLAALTPEQFAGRDDVPLLYQIAPGMEMTLPSGQWLANFATTNIYFHVSTAYGILRMKGAPLGKPDMFAGGL